MKPVLLVIAGPNGAGKTTVTARLRSDHWSQGVEYLNPDEVARDRFGDWNSPQAVLNAARWVTARREELLTQGAGIAFETVFSAPDKVDFVARAKAQGYFVRIFFIGTDDPRINAARVAGRVRTCPRVMATGRHRVMATGRQRQCCVARLPEPEPSRTVVVFLSRPTSLLRLAAARPGSQRRLRVRT